MMEKYVRSILSDTGDQNEQWYNRSEKPVWKTSTSSRRPQHQNFRIPVSGNNEI